MPDEGMQETLEQLARDLQESKARLEEAQRIAQVGHYYWNLIEDRVIWSDELYRIYGLTPQKGPIDMALCSNMIHADDREFVFRTAEDALHSEVRPDIEHRVVRPNGEVRTVHALGTVKRDPSGKPYEMFGTVQDITDRKRSEEALQRTQAHLREGQRLARMGSWTSDGSKCQWSDELFRIYGLDPQKGVPTTEEFLTIVHPQDRPSMAEAIRLMLENERGCDVTTRILRPDGQMRYVRCVGVRVTKDGVFGGFLGTAMDVTEQEVLTQELRREQAYLADAQSMAHIGSWVFNLVTRKLLYSSDENARLYGFDPSQGALPSERYFESLFPEDEPKVAATLESAVRTGTDFYLDEYRIRRTDGSIRYLRAIGHRSPSGEFGEYVGITLDVTERKHAEEERERLRQLESDLAHINRLNMMGELAAALAHEIKQPISAAITSANACIRWLEREPPDLARARAAAARIEQDGNRAADVINRLRSFYKKGLPPKREMVDLREIIRDMSALFRTEAFRHSIKIGSELDDGKLSVFADRVQLQQILMNLMLNAIEAMEDRGGELRIRAQQTLDPYLIVSISDTGVGFSTESTEQVFEAFHTTKPQGTGMGLAITRSIVEAHGGRIWATPNVGPGVTLSFTLPTKAEART
jgi:PAS domain S-box-containing protein